MRWSSSATAICGWSCRSRDSSRRLTRLASRQRRRLLEHITIAESRWRQQLANLGRTLGVDMVIPFPDGDEPRETAGRFLREAQRLLGGNDIDPAMLQVRKALETIGNASSWRRPTTKTPKDDWTAGARWALVRAALEDQASGAMHVGPGTKDYKYTRDEAEVLINMTAVLLRVMP